MKDAEPEISKEIDSVKPSGAEPMGKTEFFDNLRKLTAYVRKNAGSEQGRDYAKAISDYYSFGKDAQEACLSLFPDRETARDFFERTKRFIDRFRPDEAEKLYVSDVIDFGSIAPGKLNLVYAPCGCGKTYFAEKVLKEYRRNKQRDMLYLVPTVSLRDEILKRGDIGSEYQLPNGDVAYETKHDGITVMTYAAFGKRIAEAEEQGKGLAGELWTKGSLICADELSQAQKQSYFTKKRDVNFTKIALRGLSQRYRDKSNIVISISATTEMIACKYGRDINRVSMLAELHGYSVGEYVAYHELTTLIDNIDPDKRGLIYVRQIGKMKKVVSRLRARGIHAVGIHSMKSKGHTMDAEQMSVMRYLIENEGIPESVQVLVINAAYETGINIRPEVSRLDYIIVHDNFFEAITQVQGRYRGDIDCVYVHKKPTTEDRIIPKGVIAPYLNKKLMRSDKEELCEALNYRDDHGRPKKWTYLKGLLEKQGYSIEEGRSGNSRYSIIALQE